ncbi:TonB-dependent receptor plug domain-containing protein [Neisseria yangbaofengii]|uniref:TonB-dependent receptor plug domain-containing protein n=1 Tax=Neisseria yangbaofengii TaxID=2709396 RepID=UPI0013EB3358|nr:TonB-dependent receptor [Neisseria yangbaofengii]
MTFSNSLGFRLSMLTLALSAGFAHAEEQTVNLDEVVVKASSTAVPTRVTRSQIDREHATDLKEVMKDQIGMGVGGGTGVSQFYSIRAVGEDGINLDVDGTSQSTKIFHHQSRFMLDPALLKSINVEKGTGSASAGIGAVGGTIKATTVDAKDLLVDGKPYGVRVSAGLSSNKGNNGGVAAYTYANGFDALVAANFLNNETYKDGKGRLNNGSELEQRSYLAKIGYDFNQDHGVRLSLRQERQEGDRSNKAEFLTDDYGSYENTGQRENTANLEYHGRNLGFVSKLDANVFQIKTHDYKPPKGGEKYSIQERKEFPLELTTATARGANLDFTSDIGSHSVKYGVNFRRETTQPSDKSNAKELPPGFFSQAFPEKKTDTGVYVEGIWRFDPVTLTTGLRYDHFNFHAASGETAKDGQVNPSLGLIWDINQNLSLLATLNQASRSPRLNEALLSNNVAGFYSKVDPKLKAETARRAELGLRWNDDNLSVSGSVFHQNIKDLVVYKWGFGENKQGRIYNGGKLKTWGYEFDTKYRYGGLTARLGVSYVKPRISGDVYYGEKPIESDIHESSFTFRNMGRQWLTGLSYQFDHPKLEIGWRGRYVQKVKFYDVARKTKQADVPTYKAGYGVHDVYANWQPNGKDNFNVNFAVNNILDKKYRSHSQRFANGVARTPFYERGREFTLGVNYRF